MPTSGLQNHPRPTHLTAPTPLGVLDEDPQRDVHSGRTNVCFTDVPGILERTRILNFDASSSYCKTSENIQD